MRNSTLVRRVATFAVCALALVALGSIKNPITRPYKVHHGYAEVTFTLIDGNWTYQGFRGWGESTLFGKFTNRNGPGTPYGIVTTASGDHLYWVNPGSQWEIEFNGGTGRFENATGGLNVVSESEQVVTYPDPNTKIISWTHELEGTLTY